MNEESQSPICPRCKHRLPEPDWRCPNCYFEFEAYQSPTGRDAVVTVPSKPKPIVTDAELRCAAAKPQAWPRRKAVGVTLWIVGGAAFLIVGGSLLYFGSQEWPAIAVLLALIGISIPTLFVPYQYWTHCCQYVNTPTQDLIRLLQRQPITKGTCHLVAELGKRGPDAAAVAASPLVDVFKRCLEVKMADVLDYKNVQTSVVQSLIQMGRPADAVGAITYVLSHPPFKGDWEGHPRSFGEILRSAWLDYLIDLGPDAKTAVPLLKKITGDWSTAPESVKDECRTAIDKIEAARRKQ